MAEGGGVFSVGQEQLFCLASSELTQARILALAGGCKGGCKHVTDASYTCLHPYRLL
jgi:hypothetical protein